MAEKGKHTYKLMYFNSRGAAELSRLVFSAAGVDFTDVRYSREEWPNHKAEMPLKAMPVLEIDGKKFCQSAAIARYLAKEFGLMGADHLEELRIDEIHETMNEMMQRELIKIYYEKDDEKKKELVRTFAKEAWPTYLDFLEMRLKENNGGSGFFIGSKLSLADLIVYNGVEMVRIFLSAVGMDPLDSRPLLTALCDKVVSDPKIAEWLATRPATEF